MARKVSVEIVGDSRQLERAFSRSAKSARQFNHEIGRFGRGAVGGSGIFRSLGRSVAFASGAFLGGAGLASAVHAAFGEMADAQKVAAQTNAVLKSTGGVAGVTAGHVDTLATSLMNLSGTDDEVVKSGENLLLTFTNIRNQAGKGNDIFNQATKAALDLSVALGQDMKSSAIQLGKALQDPVRGITALRRVGVAFSDSQVKLIKHLVATGHTLDAQKLILREVQKEFGGSARAAGQTLPGKLNILRENITNLAGSIAALLTPSIEKMLDRANKWIQNSENQKHVMNDVKQVAGAVKDVFNVLKGVLEGLNSITGSTKHTLELLFGALVVFKTAQLVSTFAGIAGNIGLIGTNAGKSAGQVGRLGGAFGGLLAVGAKVGFGFGGISDTATGKTRIQAPGGKIITATGTEPRGNRATIGGIPYVKGRDGVWRPASQVDPVAGAGAVGGALRPRGRARRTPQGLDGGDGGSPFTRAQRNAFFDARLGRLLTRAQYKELQGQLAVYKQVAALLTRRIATTKDITRKLKLEDQLLSVQAQIRGTRADLAANAVQAAQDRAEKVRAAAEKARAAAEKAAARRQGRQFRALGFGPGGADLVPGVGALRKQLASVRNLSGLTAKMRSQIEQIGKVLAGKWGKVGKDVRAKIKEMLAGIRDELKGDGQGPLTRFAVQSTTQLTQGLGLTREQQLALQQRLARRGPGGTVPRRGAGLGGAFGLAAAGAGGRVVHFHGPVTVVANNPEEFLRQLDRRKRRGAVSRSGPRAGQRGD